MSVWGHIKFKGIMIEKKEKPGQKRQDRGANEQRRERNERTPLQSVFSDENVESTETALNTPPSFNHTPHT